MTFQQGSDNAWAQDDYWQGMYRPPSSASAQGGACSADGETQAGAWSQPSGQQSYGQPGQPLYGSGQQAYGQQPGQPHNRQYQYGNQPYGQPYNQPYGRPVAAKDHVAAALLAIIPILGCLGVHKFYLGYNQAGFIMLAVTVLGSLFTFGLAAIVMEFIAFIEGIIYLLKSQQEFDSIYVYNRREWF